MEHEGGAHRATKSAKSPRGKWSLAFYLCSLTLYLACLPLSSFCVYSVGCREWPSWFVLLFGWLTMPGGWPYITWLSNPLLFFSWLLGLAHAKWSSLLCALASALLALSFMQTKSIVTNEGGVANPIASYEWGYKLWVASMLCAVAAALVLDRRENISSSRRQ